MTFINTLHIISILAVKVKVVAFRLAHFQVLFFISFFFWGLYFLSPLIFLLGDFTLFFIFYYFSFFQNMGKQLAKIKVCTIYKTIKVNSKFYEPYYYRTLTEVLQKYQYLWFNNKPLRYQNLQYL